MEKVREEPDQFGLVMTVFDALAEDSALLSGIAKIGVDLSEADNLTEAEKRALLWQWESQREEEILPGTFDELAEQGEIDKENLVWEEGVLFSFAANAADAAKKNSRMKRKCGARVRERSGRKTRRPFGKTAPDAHGRGTLCFQTISMHPRFVALYEIRQK